MTAISRMLALLLASPAAHAARCQNSCTFASDGECDDGGRASTSALCLRGHDCSDCGPRECRLPELEACSNTCAFTLDNSCDDGGEGAEFSLCRPGTDCTDCGARCVLSDGGAVQCASPRCSETCAGASDGDCDDGGPGSQYNTCAFGTDCSDCGARCLLPPPSPPPRCENFKCENSCSHASDGDCDDGEEGSKYSMCQAGTDCADCGARCPATPQPCAAAACSNSCSHARDGDCDDGGEGAEFSMCNSGTDCADCGPRCGAPPPPCPNPECKNTCASASDGECDDGGEGSNYNLCLLGTDCIDCSTRCVSLTPPCTDGICGHSCGTASDGDCDDGGPGAEFSMCHLGTDCEDCGTRCELTSSPPPPPTPLPPEHVSTTTSINANGLITIVTTTTSCWPSCHSPTGSQISSTALNTKHKWRPMHSVAHTSQTGKTGNRACCSDGSTISKLCRSIESGRR